MLILHELVVILETLCTKKNGCNFKLRRSFLLILSEHNLGAVFSSLSKVWGQNSIFRFFVIFNAIYLMGSIHQNGDRLREPKVGDTRRPAAWPGSRRWVDRLCRQHERQSSSCRRLSFSVEVCASDPSVWYQICSVFLWETWLEKTGRNH